MIFVDKAISTKQTIETLITENIGKVIYKFYLLASEKTIDFLLESQSIKYNSQLFQKVYLIVCQTFNMSITYAF